MKSLRESIETAFAAAAFAEQNLDQEARAMLEEAARVQAPAVGARRDSKTQRTRPSLKA
jgi:hypothetical protein